MENRQLYLVPLGGLGNRIRFLGTVFAQPGVQCRNVTIINFTTNMFPAKLEEVFDIELENCTIVNIKFPSEKIIILLARFICFFSLLSFGMIAEYASRKYSERFILLAGHNRIASSKIQYIKTKKYKNALKNWGEYDAVHIRRTDNKRAVNGNKLESFYSFIESSKRSVFLATDDPQLKLSICERYPEKVFTLETDLARASKQNLLDATGEIDLLVRSENFMGSKGSSFSTLVEEIRDGCERSEG